MSIFYSWYMQLSTWIEFIHRKAKTDKQDKVCHNFNHRSFSILRLVRQPSNVIEKEARGHVHSILYFHFQLHESYPPPKTSNSSLPQEKKEKPYLLVMMYTTIAVKISNQGEKNKTEICQHRIDKVYMPKQG